MDNAAQKMITCIIAGALLAVMVVVVIAVFVTPPIPGLPRIVPDLSGAGPGPVMVSHTFPFQDTNVTVIVPVNASVYAGAKKTGRSAFHVRNTSDIEGDLYRAMINDPLQEPLYAAILSQLQGVRTARNLPDDEYLELITVFVQSLPCEVSDAPAKYPVETVREGTGDCDDKSLLLAGLLAREDYKVALLLFRPEKHMAVGVGSDAFLYKSTGLAYIEATAVSFVGVPSWSLKGNGTLESDPVVIVVRDGKKQYNAGAETEYIDNVSALAGRKAAGLSLELRGESIGTAADRSAYREKFRELEHYSAVHNYVLAHKYDRPGTYAYLQREMGGEPVRDTG